MVFVFYPPEPGSVKAEEMWYLSESGSSRKASTGSSSVLWTRDSNSVAGGTCPVH